MYENLIVKHNILKGKTLIIMKKVLEKGQKQFKEKVKVIFLLP